MTVIGDSPESIARPALKVGDVGGGNFFDIEPDGTFVNYGDGTTFDELSQPFIGQNLATVAGRVDYNYNELSLDFATNARYPEEPVGIVTQSPHARKELSDFFPHIHWIQTSDNVPNILIEYRLYDSGETPPSIWQKLPLTSANLVFPFFSPSIQQISRINLPIGHGAVLGLSCTIDIKIYRDSLNTSGLFADVDTYPGVWSAKYYDIHFEKDMNGSREEFVK